MKKFRFTLSAIAMAGILCACSGNTAPTATTVDSKEALEAYVETAETGGAEDKIPDASSPTLIIISVYGPDNDGDGMAKFMDAIDTLSEILLWDKLVEYKSVPETADLTAFSKTEDTASLSVTGIAENDTVAITAIANTFLENYELSSLHLTLEDSSSTLELRYNGDYADIK